MSSCYSTLVKDVILIHILSQMSQAWHSFSLPIYLLSHLHPWNPALYINSIYYRVLSFNPTMHLNNEYITNVNSRLATRKYPCSVSNAPNEFLHLSSKDSVHSTSQFVVLENRSATVYLRDLSCAFYYFYASSRANC